MPAQGRGEQEGLGVYTSEGWDGLVGLYSVQVLSYFRAAIAQPCLQEIA